MYCYFQNMDKNSVCLFISILIFLSSIFCLSLFVCLSVYIFSLFMAALLTGFVCLAICLSVSIYSPFYGAEQPIQITLFFCASICLSIYFRVCLRLKKESDVLIQPRLFIKQLAECLPIMYANVFYHRPERFYDQPISSLHLILSEHPPSHSPPLRSIVRHTCSMMVPHRRVFCAYLFPLFFVCLLLLGPFVACQIY